VYALRDPSDQTVFDLQPAYRHSFYGSFSIMVLLRFLGGIIGVTTKEKLDDLSRRLDSLEAAYPKKKIVHFGTSNILFKSLSVQFDLTVRHASSSSNEAMAEICKNHNVTLRDYMGMKMSGTPAPELDTAMKALNDEQFRDARLTATGIQQASARRDEARELKCFGGVDLIVSSPLSRCLQTAALVFEDNLIDSEGNRYFLYLANVRG
jgi:hypothetical protein